MIERLRRRLENKIGEIDVRKLPVYILVDTSESMFGEAIDQINKCLDNMLAALRRDPYALETAWLSLISFDSNARVLVPLTELAEFRVPKLNARPGTSLGTAIELLSLQLSKEVTLTENGVRGDWRPIVFLLTDGQPTDEWRGPVARLRARRPKPANIYAIGLGEEIDFSVLKEIADVTFQASEATPETLSKLFIWMSSAIRSASKNFDREGLDAAALAPPDGVYEVGDDYPSAPEFPLQLFFHATCSTEKKKYLMRLKYDESYGLYVPSTSYRLPDDFFSDGACEPPNVSSEQIACMPPCPYCENRDWASCSRCGAGFCFNGRDSRRELICPECGAILLNADGGSGSFSVRASAG